MLSDLPTRVHAFQRAANASLNATFNESLWNLSLDNTSTFDDTSTCGGVASETPNPQP